MDLILSVNQTLLNVSYANSFIKRLSGYMFRKTPHHSAIVFYPCKDIHTFFMRFDIDIIFLDREKRVVEIVFDVRRNKLIRSKENVVYTVEVPSGTVMDVSVGDVLILC